MNVSPVARIRQLPSLVLGSIIPTDAKRLLLLVAVFLSLEEKRGLIKPRLKELNDALELTDSYDHLMRAAETIRAVWHGQCPVSPSQSVAQACSVIVEWVPDFLLYDSKDKVASDVARVLTCKLA